jgi:glycosyltransferase involved in cell wall biosynthesis
MKEIIHITTAHQRYDSRIFFKECCSLAKYFKVTLVVSDNYPNEVLNNVSIISIGQNIKYKKFNRIFAIFKIIKKFFLKKNIIFHFHDPELLVLSFFFKFNSNKIIFDFHEDVISQFDVRHYLNKFQKKILKQFYFFYEFIFLRFIDFYIAATPFIAQIYQKKSKKNNVININNYPQQNLFCQVKKKKTKQNKLVYVGVITSERGIYEVINSLEFSKAKPEIYIIGKCYDDNFFYKLKQLKYFHKAKFLGWKKSDEIFDLIQDCAAGLVNLLPRDNYYESQPTKLYEYMMAGLPIIASNFESWICRYQKYNCCLFVDPLDLLDISNKIDQICLDSNLQKFLSQNAIKASKSIFNWNNEEKKLIELYKVLQKSV